MALVALLFLSLVLFSFSTKNTTLAQAHCLPDQRQALIQLKQGFNSIELHSWNASTDCCLWDGITCDEQTGLVTALNLAGWSISGELNPALFNLSSLRYLDLSYNFFDDTPLPQTGFEQLGRIPSEFASLQKLELLDLSSNQLSGPIPQELTSLTCLETLNLSYNNLSGEIPEGNEFSSFSSDSYQGNPGLCGRPLSMQCATAPSNNGFNEGLPNKGLPNNGLPSDYSTSTDTIGFSVSIGVGLYLGFTSVIWALVFWENGRKWFILVTDKFYFQYFQ